MAGGNGMSTLAYDRPVNALDNILIGLHGGLDNLSIDDRFHDVEDRQHSRYGE